MIFFLTFGVNTKIDVMKKLLFSLIFVSILFSCSDEDKEPKENNSKKYIERSKERIAPLLGKWEPIEVNYFNKFELLGKINSTFVNIEFEAKSYSSTEDNRDYDISYHKATMYKRYKDRGVTLMKDYPIHIGEQNVTDDKNGYKLSFNFYLMGASNDYQITFLDNNTLLLSYKDNISNEIYSQKFSRIESLENSN